MGGWSGVATYHARVSGVFGASGVHRLEGRRPGRFLSAGMCLGCCRRVSPKFRAPWQRLVKLCCMLCAVCCRPMRWTNWTCFPAGGAWTAAAPRWWQQCRQRHKQPQQLRRCRDVLPHQCCRQGSLPPAKGFTHRVVAAPPSAPAFSIPPTHSLTPCIKRQYASNAGCVRS